MMKIILLIIITRSSANEYENSVTEVDDRHYCGLINSFSTLQHVQQFTYLGYKVINVTVHCDEKKIKNTEAVYYKVDNKFYIHYAKLHCVKYNVTPKFELQDDNYFNERSCCDLGQYLDLKTKHCINVQLSCLHANLQHKFQRYQKFINKKWLEKKWRAKSLVDYEIDLSNFQSDQIKSKAKLLNNKKFVLSTKKENENYCIARTNRTILLRVKKEMDCNKNECIPKCFLRRNNSIYVSWYQNVSTDIMSMKNVLSHEPDIVLRSTFSCNEKITKVVEPWSWYSPGNLVLLGKNVKLKKDHFCFNLEKGDISLLTCDNYLDENKNEIQHQPGSVDLKDDCNVYTCITKCNLIDEQYLNLSEVSLQKKYIYVNDTFLINNRNFIMQLTEKYLSSSMNCTDGFLKLPFKWSIVDQSVLNLPNYGIFIDKLDYCLYFDNDVYVYTCKDTHDKILEQIQTNLVNECRTGSCIRKCENVDEKSMRVILYRYKTEELINIKNMLATQPDVVVEQDLNCSDGFEMLRWKWSLTGKGDLLLKDFGLILKTEDYCFKNEAENVEVYACKTIIDKLEHDVSGIIKKRCQINTCIRKCGHNDNFQINVSFYEFMNVDAIDDVRHIFVNSEDYGYQEPFICEDGFNELNVSWILTPQGELNVTGGAEAIIKTNEYCFDVEEGEIKVVTCKRILLQLKSGETDITEHTTSQVDQGRTNDEEETGKKDEIKDNDIVNLSDEKKDSDDGERKNGTEGLYVRRCVNESNGDAQVTFYYYNATNDTSQMQEFFYETNQATDVNGQFHCPEGFEMLPQEWTFVNRGDVFVPKYDMVIDKDEYCLNVVDNQTQLYVCKNETEDGFNEIKSLEQKKSSTRTIMIGSSTLGLLVVSSSIIYVMYKRWKKEKKK